MKKITPFLWFDGQAEEAMEFYVSLFKNSKILSMNRLPSPEPGAKGAVTSGSFVLEGQEFIALNGGPQYKFTEAVSFLVNCKSQAEVDDLWNKLSAGGGEEGPCGWLKDKFSLSWQIIPEVLSELLGDPDPIKSQRTLNAMLQMKKIDIAGLQKAHDGG